MDPCITKQVKFSMHTKIASVDQESFACFERFVALVLSGLEGVEDMGC